MYRKLKADRIFNGHEMFQDDSVLVLDENGVVNDIVLEVDAGDEIEVFDGTLSPGFINCHCHLELSHLRNKIPKQTGLIEFVTRILNERNATEADIFNSIEYAEKEMLQNGIVAVGDICNTHHTISQKAKSKLYYHNFIEVSGFPEAVASQRFERILDLYHRFHKELKHNSIVPHAPYSVSSALFEKIAEFPNNEIISMHNQETAAENELYNSKTGEFLDMYAAMNISSDSFQPIGKSSLHHCLKYFNINKPLILVHNVFTDEEDLAYASDNFNEENLFYCLCPNANLYISNRLPDVDMFTNHELNLVMGTDSLASNDKLCILDEMLTIQNHFPSIKMDEMLKWATINGARALQIDDQFGSFEKGKKPGVVLIHNNTSKLII